MAGKSFTAQLADFEQMTVKNMRYVAAESIQDVMEAAQTPQKGIGQGATGFVEGKIPVDTAELINSLTSEGVKGADSYTVAIAGYEVGDVMSFAWTAPHALAVEAGTSKMPGRHFVGVNARRFPAFVEKRAKEARG
ncbi:hypothetical protein [Sulfitobacter dubius]|uniref:HK97 gp10 family phage protein n=1 Tax=Sulfitobacter dubius TaxID=218673 RepID=A0ABY3ZK73_9RHOB|nr:hypothetical protein [Sulfitobacter dubius]UOA14520.1 hypothetical protein DSM109990_01326 [Sulfitobacter dubius]